jgi:hypothetical protein
MIVKEEYLTRKDGVKLYRTYSDEGKYVIQNETGIVYGEAIDVENAPYTYSECSMTNAERKYWQSIPYDEAVDAEIRKRYSISQEFAVLRQADTKPEEYAAYFAYCEECKTYVKQKKNEVTI